MSDSSIIPPPDSVGRCRVILRRLVLAEIAVTLLVIAVAFVQTPLLPPALQEFEQQAAQRAGPREVILMWLAAPLFVFVLVTWVALFRGWRSGRMLYTALWCAGIPLMLLTGPGVYTELSAITDAASSMLGGLILGFLYFSEIRHFYNLSGNA